VDEMFQQFKKDPQSVDKEWRELFESQGGPQAEKATPATPEAKKTASPQSSTSGKSTATAAPAATTAPASAPAKAAPVKQNQASKPAKKAKESPLSKPVAKPEPGTTPLRGIFKSIAKNMDLSLEVPTATSVRDMPARLMFENRAMVNDQLTRPRGGKISFATIISYAMVKAVMAHPDMNNSYDIVDGKPSLIVPEHITPGLAIDLPQKDGSRALVVAA